MPKFYVTTQTGKPSNPSHLREIVEADSPASSITVAIHKALNLKGEVTIGRFIVVSERGFQEDEDDYDSHVVLSEEVILANDARFV